MACVPKALVLLLCLPMLIHCQLCTPGCYCSAVHRLVACYTSANLSTVPRWNIPLERIYIGGNHIFYLREEHFRNYANLSELNLPNNAINFVSYSTFAHNTDLRALNLDKNIISEIQPKTFKDLQSLRVLVLSNNRLHKISTDVFEGLDNLHTLSLKNNNISTIPFSAVSDLALQTLDVSGNPLHCNCAIAWMKDHDAITRAESPLTCHTPSSLASRSMYSLSHEELGCVLPQASAVEEVVIGFNGDESVVLECRVEGDPEPGLTWYREGMRLSEDIHYRINGKVLTLVFFTRVLAGDYTCVAENAVGRDSAVISVQFAGDRLPVLTRLPSNIHVFVGSSFFLPCAADQFTGTFQWLKDGTVLSPSANLLIQPGLGLRVLRAGRSHSGMYRCVLTNTAGSVGAGAEVQVTDDVITCDGIFSPDMFEDLREKVSLAFNRTQQELQLSSNSSSNSPSSLLRRLKFPESGIIEYLKAAEVFDQAVAMLRNQLLNNASIHIEGEIPNLSECELEVLAQLSGCKEHQREEADCSGCFHQKYRSADGSCNNLDRPLQGASDIPFQRLMVPAYEDGIGAPVGWSGNKPSARLISRNLISANKVTGDQHFSLMLMQFGQFLDHDLDLAPGSPSDIVFDIDNPDMLSSCDSICDNDSPCFPIPVADDDPRIDHQCLSFTRSSAVCGTGASSLLLGTVGIHRQQINVITSYIDGSMIYGSSARVAGKLREPGESGKLLEGILLESGKKLLPFDNDSLIECSTGIHANRSGCFLGGDVRTNEQVGLTSMHTLFYREHNRVVGNLVALNPHWNGERLYQEARKIVVAEWQHIVFTQYLPKILGPGFLGEYKAYDPTVDATIANAFATAAYRFGHSQIMPLFPRLDSDYESLPIGPLKLQDAFFAPFRILEGGIDPLIRGLVASPVKMRLTHQSLNNNLTEALFTQAHEIALDLAALNIQRGRDHGLPSYNKWRLYSNLTAPSTIEGLKNEIRNSTIRSLLRSIYGDDPDNIDLWVGGLLEEVLPDSQLGPTFRHIIGEQFGKLRDGDRFYYERPGQFSPDQLVELKQASLSRIICDNADNIDHIPLDAFVLQNSSMFVSCRDIPRVELSLWEECGECDEDGVARRKRSALFTPDHDSLLTRMSELEKRVGMCKFNGAFYSNQDSWALSNCTKCRCQNGDVQCQETCGTDL